MGRDGNSAGGTTGVAARNNGMSTNEAPRAPGEAGCGTVTGMTEWGGVGATAACKAKVVGQDIASTGGQRGGGVLCRGGHGQGPVFVPAD